jgi:hypothetical protein
MALRPIDSSTTRVALHQSARSRGYKLLREIMDPRSLWWSVCVDLVRCVLLFPLSFLDVAPTSPFIVPKGRVQVTFVVKR